MIYQSLLTFEVADFENRSTRLSRSSLQLGAVDFNKTMFMKVFTEEIADNALEFKYSLISLRLQQGRSLIRTKKRPYSLEDRRHGGSDGCREAHACIELQQNRTEFLDDWHRLL